MRPQSGPPAPRHPAAIFIQSSTGCNARCTHCPHHNIYGGQPIQYMSDEMWELILVQLAAERYTGQVGFYLHCEPLIDKRLPAWVEAVLAKTNAHIVISTNGHLLTPERLPLPRSGRIQLLVNIPSANPPQYKQMTGLDFAQVRDNVLRFYAHNRYACRRGITTPVLPGVAVDKIGAAFPGLAHYQHWATSRAGLVPGVNARGRHTNFNGSSRCTQPLVNLAVRWDGGILRCCQDWKGEHVVGNVTYGMFNVWRGKSMNRYRDEFAQHVYRDSDCKLCASEMCWERAPQ